MLLQKSSPYVGDTRQNIWETEDMILGLFNAPDIREEILKL